VEGAGRRGGVPLRRDKSVFITIHRGKGEFRRLPISRMGKKAIRGERKKVFHFRLLAWERVARRPSLRMQKRRCRPRSRGKNGTCKRKKRLRRCLGGRRKGKAGPEVLDEGEEEFVVVCARGKKEDPWFEKKTRGRDKSLGRFAWRGRYFFC